MPTIIEINASTGRRTTREVELTAQQIATGEAERAEQDARAARAATRAAALTVLAQRGEGPPTRAEFESLQDAVRELLIASE